MVVEDDPDIRLQMVEILSQEGYHTLSAEHGRTALELLRQLPKEALPGCILLDLSMPVMNGAQLLKILKTEHPDDLGQIPVLIATAKGGPHSGLDDLPKEIATIRKPMDIDDLLNAIEQLYPSP